MRILKSLTFTGVSISTSFAAALFAKRTLPFQSRIRVASSMLSTSERRSCSLCCSAFSIFLRSLISTIIPRSPTGHPLRIMGEALMMAGKVLPSLHSIVYSKPRRFPKMDTFMFSRASARCPGTNICKDDNPFSISSRV